MNAGGSTILIEQDCVGVLIYNYSRTPLERNAQGMNIEIIAYFTP